MSSSVVAGNTAAVHWDGNSTLSYNNAARAGGGIYIKAKDVNATMGGGSNWSGNTAGGSGGGLFVEMDSDDNVASIKVDGASVLGSNQAAQGGAIYIQGFASFNMSGNSTMVNNTAKQDGGAVLLNRLPTVLALDSCTVANNRAARGSGGAFYISTVGAHHPVQ